MRAFSLDLLQKGQNDNAQIVFDPLTRAIRVKDLYVAEFLLPYLVLHVVVGDASAKEQREEVVSELVNILKYEPPEAATYHEREHMKLYYEVSVSELCRQEMTDMGARPSLAFWTTHHDGFRRRVAAQRRRIRSPSTASSQSLTRFPLNCALSERYTASSTRGRCSTLNTTLRSWR
jgi:hypothetical protein